MMSESSNGGQKKIWAKIIKEKMVKVDGSQSIYRLSEKKNKSVEIQLYPRNLPVLPQRQSPLSKVQLPVGQRNVTLDVSRADFLILNKEQTAMKQTQYIPWNKIAEIVFRDE
jgi:hypothetical protein